MECLTHEFQCIRQQNNRKTLFLTNFRSVSDMKSFLSPSCYSVRLSFANDGISN